MIRRMTRMRVAGAAMVLGSAGSLGLWGWTHHRVETHLYTASDFGGYIGANRKRLPDTPLQRASDAFAAGRYGEAEQIAGEVIGRAGNVRPAAQTPLGPEFWGSGGAGHEALLARRILAYASARQSRFAEAKTRFGALRQAAYESPDHGRQRVSLGDSASTLEEEGAFQAAVCTGALGDKRAAESELDGFMREYPRSVLVHAAVKRIGRMHGGDVPRDAEALWKQAMAVQKTADEKERRDQALCGPECLAEMLKRQYTGKTSRQAAKPQREIPKNRMGEVQTLAAEMRTSGEGSSVAAMQATAAKHGLKLQGVSMTLRGLTEQKLPLIALIAPGHYVLVEAVTPSPTPPGGSATVTVWDPDARGMGAPGRRVYTTAEWGKSWNGAALR